MGRRYEVRSHPLEGAVGECALREVSRGRGTDSSSGFVLVVCGYPAVWYKYPVLGALATKHMDQEDILEEQEEGKRLTRTRRVCCLVRRHTRMRRITRVK